MKRLLLALGLFLAPTSALAGWTSRGTILNSADRTGAASWAPATSGSIKVGDVAVCSFAKDETGTGTTDGDNSQVTGVTDAAGNTWNKAIEFCNMQTSTAQDGACSDVWWTQTTVALSAGSTITFTFSASTTTKAVTCMSYEPTGVVTLAAGANGIANDAADPGALTDTTGIVRDHLFIRASACESNVTTYTADSDYVAFDGQGAASTQTTGVMGARGEYRIATEDTSASSDPTYATADCASTIIALDTTTAPGWTGWW